MAQWDQEHLQKVCRWQEAEWCGWNAWAMGRHPKRPGKAQQVDTCEPHKVQQCQMWGPKPESGQLPVVKEGDKGSAFMYKPISEMQIKKNNKLNTANTQFPNRPGNILSHKDQMMCVKSSVYLGWNP